METTELDEGPRPGARPAMAIYYVIFFIIFPFFFVNIFVALIIITFQDQGDSELQDQNLDKNQKQCIDFVVNAKPMDRYVPRNKDGFQHKIWTVVNCWPFDFFVMLIIALNTIVLMTKFYKEPGEYTALDLYFTGKVLNYVNIVFTSVFTVECALKVYAFGPKNYFRDAWNAFDFITVVGSIVDIFVSNFSEDGGKDFNLGFLRLFRAARLIKLLRQSYTIRTLLWTFVQSIKALPYVCLLIVMLFFIYAIVAMQIFGNIELLKVPDSAINRHNNFQDIFSSLILLFRCCTGEAWQLIMLDCLSPRPCDPKAELPEDSCGSTAAYIYFTSFVFLSSFLMLNLFVAVIMDNFDYLTRDASILGPHHLDEFIRVWSEYDPAATSRIHYTDMYEMLRKMEPPVGFGKNCPYRLAYRKLIRMNIPISKNQTVHFRTTLFALIRETLQIQTGPVEQMNKFDGELKQVIQNLWPVQSKKMSELLVPPNEELMHDKLTTGKIYAGKIILENWKAYKECILRGESGPKPKLLTMFNFAALEDNSSETLWKKGLNLFRRSSKAKSPNGKDPPEKGADGGENKFQALVNLAKKVQEKEEGLTDPLADKLDISQHKHSAKPQNPLSTIREEGSTRSRWPLLSSANGFGDHLRMDDPRNASPDFHQISNAYTNVHAQEDTNNDDCWDPFAYDIHGNRVSPHHDGPVKQFTRGQSWGAARAYLEKERQQESEERNHKEHRQRNRGYNEDKRSNLAGALLGMTTVAVTASVLKGETNPQGPQKSNENLVGSRNSPDQTFPSRNPNDPDDGNDFSRETYPLLDATDQAHDRPCSPPEARKTRTPRTPRKVSNLETVPELVSRSPSTAEDQNLFTYTKPKVQHNKDIGNMDSHVARASSRDSVQLDSGRLSAQRYDDRSYTSRMSDDRVLNDMSAASSFTSIRTGDISADNSGRPRPAPRRKADGMGRGVSPSESYHSVHSPSHGQAPPYPPRPRERNRLDESDPYHGNDSGRGPSQTSRENYNDGSSHHRLNESNRRQRTNPFIDHSTSRRSDYNIDESEDVTELRDHQYHRNGGSGIITGSSWEDECYDSDRTLPSDYPSRVKQSYHGRNALLDIDPQSIQQAAIPRQESFEQNDDRRYIEETEARREGKPRHTTTEQSSYDNYTPGARTHVKGHPNIITQDDDEDGEWC